MGSYSSEMDLIELAKLTQEISEEFPSFKIVLKSESRLMKAISFLLLLLSFGQMRGFSKFITTLGVTVYVPAHWGSLDVLQRCAVLRHERVHMRQARRHGRLLFSLMYLFLPFPFFAAWFRAEFEKEAYAETLRAYHEYGAEIDDPGLRDRIVQHFTGSDYLWMWPFRARMEAWYAQTVRQIKVH